MGKLKNKIADYYRKHFRYWRGNGYLFAVEGAKVVVVGHRKEKVEKVVELIHASCG